MASQRDSKKAQQDFFANMQTAFLGSGNGDGIVGQLKTASEDLVAAADMLRQNTQAQPSYGGPNGGRPTFNGNGTVRPNTTPDYGGGYAGYNGVRGQLAQAAASRIGSSGSVLTQGNTYSEVHGADGRVVGYDEYDKSGKRTGVRHAAGTTQGNEAAKVVQRQAVAASVGGAIGQGQIFSRGPNGEVHTPGVGVAQSLVKHIPWVGGALAGLLGAPDAIGNAVVNQRAKNAQYQSILGGTNSSTGFHNRRLEEGFKLSQMFSGGLNGAMSEEAFKGVTSLGYTGDNRNQSLGLITSNYKNLGMSVGESLQFVNTMAKTSSTNFEALKVALNEVSTEAKNTGQNLQQARQNLSNLFSVAAQTNGGPGALGVASSVANYQTGLGRNYANVDFSNMIPGKNTAITGMMANSLGMNMGTYMLQQAGGGAGAKLSFDKAADKQSAMSVSTAVANPQVVNIINQLAQKNGGKAKILADNNSLQNFVQICLRDSDFQSIVGPYIMTLGAATSAYMGAAMNPEQIAENIIRQVLGANASFENMDKAQQAKMQQSTVDIKTGAGTTPTKGGGAKGPATTKTVDPILDKFKKYANSDTHVKVKTAQGDMVVSGKYAADHLKDQIAMGTATFMDGQYAGQSVAEALGGGFGESNYAGKKTTDVGTNSHFTSVDKFNAKSSGGGGTVTIAPNPQLAQLLSFSATGNITMANQGAASGLVPQPGQPGISTGG